MADAAHEVLYRFTADEEGVLNALRRIEAELRDTTRRKWDIRLNLAAKDARAEMLEFKTQLRELEQMDVSPEIKLLIAKALADISLFETRLNALPRNKTVTLETRTRGLRDLAVMNRLANGVQGGVLKIEKALSGAGDEGSAAMDRLSQAVKKAVLFLRRLPAVVSGLAISIAVALTPAIIGAIAGLTGMTASAGAMASTLIATAIPAVGLLATAIGRLTAVMNVFNLLQSAQKANIRSGVSDSRRDAVETQSRAAAHRAVADAQRAEQRASQDLKDAQAALGQAAADAMHEMADAAREARDAVLDLAQAQLSLADAKLSTEQAKLDLQEFRDGLGQTGEAFDKLFKKFTDVNFQFSGAALDKIFGDTDAAKGDQLELERLILAVRQAKLNEKTATNDLTDAETGLSEARALNLKFQRQGIAASEGYQGALKRVEDASIAVTDAQRNTNEAMADSKRNMDRLASATTGVNSARALYRAELKKLSPEERNFLKELRGTRNVLRKLEQQMTAPIFDLLAAGLHSLPGILRQVKGDMRDLAATWATTGGVFAKTVKQDLDAGVFKKLIKGAQNLSESFGNIFIDFYRIVINLGQAALPMVEKLVSDISDSFNDWANGTESLKAVRKAIAPGFELMRIVVSGIASAIEGLFGVFQAGSGPINDFFGFIRDGLKAFADWTKSDKGREQIREFFEDTLPLVKSLIKFFVKIGIAALKIVQIMAPILKPTLDFFIFLVDILIAVLRAVDFVIGPFKTLIGVLLSFLLGGRIVTGVFKGISFVLTHFGALFGRVISVLRGGVGEFVGAFKGLLTAIKFVGGKIGGVLGKLIGVIRKVWSAVTGVIRRPFERGFDFIRGALDAAKNWIAGAVRRIIKGFSRAWEGLKSVISWVLDRFRAMKDAVIGIFERLGRGIKAAFEGVKKIVKGVLNVLIGVANKFIRAWNAVFGKERKIKGPGPLPDITLPSLKLGEIPKLAAGGIVAKDTLFRAGEGSGSEAVIPLSKSVLRRLGQAIAKAMGSGPIVAAGMPMMAGAGPRLNSGAGSVVPHHVIEQVDVHLPAPPSGGIPDPRYSAALFAKEIKRRGW